MKIALVIAAACAISSAWIYERNVNPGNDPSNFWWLAVASGLAALLWVRTVYPFMGKRWIRDLFLVCLAFPAVGALAGLFAGFGLPVGIAAGVIVSVTLPWMFPVQVLPIYALGICAALTLPRLRPLS
ncbi:hypothetical protein [uncultured Tateyamaria sp.]|uniref:hypothetical protein n=1 Tax=uncultured Tateyamaria sp. TaxID=455651 RepID=UPI002620BF61|nr:hypothetical protein [uncultured Tateyamaria sp.]